MQQAIKSHFLSGWLLHFCAPLSFCQFFLALGLGAVHISLPDTYAIIMNRLFGIEQPGTGEVLRSANASIIWKIRFPRVLLGVAAGAGLALCGSVMQATVQNPLAEPYILGISSGASLGATIAVFIGTAIPLAGSISSVSLLAFLGAAGALVQFYSWLLWADKPHPAS